MVEIHSPWQRIRIIAIISLILSFVLASCTQSSAKSSSVVFLGDSRTVGMYQTIHPSSYHDAISINRGNESWYAKCSQGYSYFVHVAVPQMEQHGIPQNAKIFVLFGVNDCSLSQASRYASYLNQKSQEWEEDGATTYFVSVNPVNDAKSRWVKNTQVRAFNQAMKQKLNTRVHYVDTFSALYSKISQQDSATDREGLHFQADSYRYIYEQCLLQKSNESHPILSTSKSTSTTSRPVSTHPTQSLARSSSTQIQSHPNHSHGASKLGVSAIIVIILGILGVIGVVLI